MKIRPTKVADIDTLKGLFERGRLYQVATGNVNQWTKGYPSTAILKEDIAQQGSYVVEIEQAIVGSFFLLKTPDPTYTIIEEGQWLNDAPYVTVHRLVTVPNKGLGKAVLRVIMNQYDNVRIDTHEQNSPMRHVLETLGFQYCGIIFLANGDPRVAYHWTKAW
ncbi:N-acetyltransferase [Tuanshanicoccus lijuaniae]|uniref:N-acetyltransferase n=1 Tax=Aerococcaceae bacterium zg-1292 TaxID=2774330 RepID=UPI001BD89AEB|nr:N-acetyltransferase [Aerococcaceae bacterium zg-A91]MBS4458140.1 N-acetyltransferase [Aerococcaceae bacterium zg-BR33]